MKKQVLSLALVATIISIVAIGCSSSEKATMSDSTSVDSTTMVDTTKNMDTTKMDTTKKM